jgi:SAM-dependent methyltransferase
MPWVCIRDQGPLQPAADGASRCARCGRSYRQFDGIPIFPGDGAEAERAARRPPALEELLRWMRERGAAEAAETFCRRQRCSRRRFTTDWKFFLPCLPDGRVLELGAGYGDDTVDLSETAAATASLVPQLGNALIVQQHLRERRRSNVAVAVVPSLAALPLADSSFNAIGLEDAAAASFGLCSRTLAVAAAEWQRVLVPGGTLILGLSNPLHLPRAWTAPLFGAREPCPSLNRVIKQVSASGPAWSLGLGRTLRCLRRRGFSQLRLHAPLPDQDDTKIVIPLADAALIRHSLHNQARRNSVLVRAALGLGGLAAELHLLQRLLPYYFVVATRSAAGRGAGEPVPVQN